MQHESRQTWSVWDVRISTGTAQNDFARGEYILCKFKLENPLNFFPSKVAIRRFMKLPIKNVPTLEPKLNLKCPNSRTRVKPVYDKIQN